VTPPRVIDDSFRFAPTLCPAGRGYGRPSGNVIRHAYHNDQNKPGGFRNVFLAERARLLAGASHNLEALTIPDGAAIEDHAPQT
jgi:hypothetical protein